MSVPAVHEYGPYTLYDLDALPEDGKHYELSHGWLTELSPSPRHDHAAGRLKDILKDAPRLAGADVYVAGGLDRVRKAGEYAKAGIPVYWIVDLEPEMKVTVLALHDGKHVLDAEIRAGQALTASQPIAVSFDPASLTEPD